MIDPATIVYHESSTDENDNYVHFRVGTEFGKFTKGNVILALKDLSGRIVWTWHIWITDKPEEILYEGGISFIDRNIGALSAQTASSPIDNFGFVYQWGRKDPFFGGDGINNGTPLDFASYTIHNAGTSWQHVQTSQIAGYEKQNPMTFISNNPRTANLSTMLVVDWLSVSDPNRWSDSNKTDHDPCPSGYKVPGMNKLQALHNAYDAWVKGGQISQDRYFKNEDNWRWIYKFTPVSGGISQSIWPAAGMRQGRNGNNSAQLIHSGTATVKGQCYYWSSSPFKVGTTTVHGVSLRVHTSGNILYSVDDYSDNADAYPIRCVKE